MALIGDPELLFLDEPTTGFDPSARRQAWETIAGLRDLGKTVFLTTHYMDEAQRLADRVTVISAGEIVARGHPRGPRRPREPPGADQLSRGRARGRAGDDDAGPDPQRADRQGAGGGQGPRRAGGRPAQPRGRLPGADRPDMSLVLHQFRYDQKAFWRNPASVFFTVAFPVVLLLIFATVFGNQTVDVRGGIKTTTYYVPAIITLSVISATMQSLAMSLVIAREDGRLKRGRGTPMPPWVFIAGRIGNSIVVALMMLVAARGDRPPRLRRRNPLGPAARDRPHPRRRRRVLLLPRHRADGGDPQPGRRGADRQRPAAAALLPLRRLHPRRPAAQRRHPLRRRLPDPPLLRGLLRRLRPRRRRRLLGQPRRGRDLGRGRPAARRPLLPLDPARRLTTAAPIASRARCCTTFF